MPTRLRSSITSTSVAVNIVPADLDRAFDADVVNQVVHAVEAAEQGGFAAAGRADEGGDDLLAERERNVLQRLARAVKQRERSRSR